MLSSPSGISRFVWIKVFVCESGTFQSAKLQVRACWCLIGVWLKPISVSTLCVLGYNVQNVNFPRLILGSYTRTRLEALSFTITTMVFVIRPHHNVAARRGPVWIQVQCCRWWVRQPSFRKSTQRTEREGNMAPELSSAQMREVFRSWHAVSPLN